MFGPKVKIDKLLFDRLKEHAAKAGYSSMDEFVNHILEKELSRHEGVEAEDEVKKRLEGLGYMS